MSPSLPCLRDQVLRRVELVALLVQKVTKVDKIIRLEKGVLATLKHLKTGRFARPPSFPDAEIISRDRCSSAYGSGSLSGGKLKTLEDDSTNRVHHWKWDGATLCKPLCVFARSRRSPARGAKLNFARATLWGLCALCTL